MRALLSPAVAHDAHDGFSGQLALCVDIKERTHLLLRVLIHEVSIGRELAHTASGINELLTQQKVLKEQLSSADKRRQRSKKAKAAAARSVRAAEQVLHETERQAWPS